MHPHVLANDNLVAINFASTRGVSESSIELELQTSNHIETRTRSGFLFVMEKEFQKKNHLLQVQFMLLRQSESKAAIPHRLIRRQVFLLLFFVKKNKEV